MRVGIFSTHQKQQPFAEFADNEWKVWISYKPDLTSGTYLQLSPTGSVDRVTINNNEILEIVKIC